MTLTAMSPALPLSWDAMLLLVDQVIHHLGEKNQKKQLLSTLSPLLVCVPAMKPSPKASMGVHKVSSHPWFWESIIFYLFELKLLSFFVEHELLIPTAAP